MTENLNGQLDIMVEMTDQELIQRLQEKSVGELTPDEIEALRARWTQSPELRQALADHLRLESLLTGALGPKRLDVDAILESAINKRSARGFNRHHWLWLLGLCLLVGIGVRLIVSMGKPRPIPHIAQDSPRATEPTNETVTPQREPDPIGGSAADPKVAKVEPTVPPNDHSAEAKPEPVLAPAVDPVIAKLDPGEPWSAAFSRDVAQWADKSTHWTDSFKAAGHDELPDSEARRWLGPVEGLPYGWSTDSVGNPGHRIARFNGLAKLRAPWPQDAVLRMTPFEVADLTIYFWHGPSGVALRYYTRREPYLWAAFEISRENSSPRPTRWGLLTTDSGSYSRSTPGTLDIRQQDDELVLARGGIVLLSVPFIGPPVEVFVEGQFRLRGFSMHRSAPFPSIPDKPHSTVMADQAAKLAWAISPESPASLTDNADGSLTMTVDSPNTHGTISFPFGWILAMQGSPRASSLYEVIVRVDSADPGTGIFLGDRNGRPVHQLGFFRDGPTQQIAFATIRPGALHTDLNFNLNDYPAPYLSKPGWFKLTAGLGTFHVQVSGDGRHWGHVVENPARDWNGAVASMGLYGFAGPSARSIRISQVQIRELSGITRLANQDQLSLAPQFNGHQLQQFDAWRHQVLNTKPIDVSETDWFNTCAVALLSQGPARPLALDVLHQLVAVGMKSSLTFERKQQLLDDACALCDLFDDGAAKTLGKWYEELGWQLARAGDPDPLAKLRPAWLTSSIWTTSKMKYVWEQLLSHEIVMALNQHDWAIAWRLAQSAPFWNMPPHPDHFPVERGEFLERHARWAKSIVADAAPQLDDGTSSIMPAGLRHPLAPLLNKEAYNTRADLQSALSSGSYEDACRILISINPNDGSGLLPDVEDRDLFVSLRTSISIARRSHRGFADVMSDRFAAQGIIRVRSAINRRDIAGLQAATLQFMGTDAARKAHTWLGDLALSGGQFDSAEQQFRLAQTENHNASPDALEPRVRLAQALAGRIATDDWSKLSAQLPPNSIDLNGKVISRDEFISLINQVLAHHQLQDSLHETPAVAATSFPQSGYRLELRSQFDGHPGLNPGRWEFRFGDPFGRQFATAVDQQRIYVSNRFQVNAYAATTGQQLWAQGLGSEQGEAYAMPFAPMKPLLAGDRMYVRRLTKAGAELACLATNDGQVIWNQRPFTTILSDPVVWHGKLFALAQSRIDDDMNQIVAAWFDFKTGALLTQKPLFRLRDIPERQFSAEMTIAENMAICTVAGTTACFDSQGETNWVRRQLLMIRPIDDLFEDQRMSRPMIVGSHVIVSSPGVRVINCLDVETGRVVWQQPFSDLRGLRGIAESIVLVDNVSSLVALDAQTGHIVWNYDAKGQLEGVVIDGPRLVVTRRANLPNNRSKPLLAWLNLHTGAQLAQTMAQIPEHEECQIGPIFAAGGKWWSLVGQSWKEPRRELQEFVPIATATPESFHDPVLKDWSPELPDSKLAEIAAVVPGWFAVADYRDRLTLHPEEIQGESFSLLSRLEPQHEMRFTHQLNLPAGSKSRLMLRIANRPGQKWNLTVRHQNELLLSQVIEDQAGTNGWRTVSVDLSSLAGQSMALQLMQSSLSNATTEALWRQAIIVSE